MRRCIALFELAYFFGEKPNELLYDFGERGRRTQLLISEAVQLSCAGGHVAAPRAKEGLEVAGDAYRSNLHDFVLQRGRGRTSRGPKPRRRRRRFAATAAACGRTAAIAPTPPTHSEARNFGQ